MPTLKAPFNFVPLPDKTFFPDWADQISHDIPFSDGISGTIELKITAESRIFVRNGHRHTEDPEDTLCLLFSQTNGGHYFIPGSSIKGAIRNVFEVLSLGKINFIQNHSFGIRDLSKSADGNFYRDIIKPDSIHCGWMSKNGEDVEIEDCGLPKRISSKEIDKIYHRGLHTFVTTGEFKEDKMRTAKYKYELLDNCNLQITFGPDRTLMSAKSKNKHQFVCYDAQGEMGTIVLTGQPGRTKIKKYKNNIPIWDAKYYEFVFSEPIGNPKPVGSSVFNAFESIHNESPDYKDFWKKKLYSGELIPVFFRIDDNDEVESIGTAYMYKYPAHNSVFNAVRPDDLDSKFDLAQCVFGALDKNASLKGRVQFGHAFMDEECQPQFVQEKISLSSPRDSYYPYYLGNGQTWNSETARIAGYKRYPTRHRLMDPRYYPGTKKMTNTMNLMEAGPTFRERICFHNLRPIELGALLAAITFDGHGECRHNLGSGKPLGMGKVRVEMEGFDAELSNRCLQAFRQAMEQTLPGWADSQPIKELLAMAAGIPEGREDEFVYMHMDTQRDKNEFLAGKERYSQGEQLGSFTQILNRSVPNATFAGNTTSMQRVDIEKVLLERQERQDKYNDCLFSAEQAILEHDYDKAEGALASASKYTVSTSQIEELLQQIKDLRQQDLQKADAERQAREKEEQRLRGEQFAQSGLVCLDEKSENGQFKVKDLKVLVQKVEKWMKSANVSSIPTDQQEYLSQALQRIYNDLKPRDKAPWDVEWNNLLTDKESKKGPWLKVIDWVGADAAQAIYRQVRNLK